MEIGYRYKIFIFQYNNIIINKIIGNHSKKL